MKTARGASYVANRIRQTPVLFRNFPRVFFDLAVAETPWRADEMTFRLRNGYTVVSPNSDGARFPLYEIFADDAYRLEALCVGVDPNATVVDVGGQIGCFSLALSEKLPTARVHVYEASPVSASYVAAQRRRQCSWLANHRACRSHGRRGRHPYLRRQRHRERAQRIDRPRGVRAARSPSRAPPSTRPWLTPGARCRSSRWMSRGPSTTSSCVATRRPGPTCARSLWNITRSRGTPSTSSSPSSQPLGSDLCTMSPGTRAGLGLIWLSRKTP